MGDDVQEGSPDDPYDERVFGKGLYSIKDPSQRLLCLNVFDKMRYETVPMESRHSFFAFLLKSDIFRLQFGQITSLELFSL